MGRKLKVLIVGGEEQKILTEEVRVNVDPVHLGRHQHSIPTAMADKADVIVVMTKWCSGALMSKARDAARKRKIPFVNAKTGNYIIHELVRQRIISEPVKPNGKATIASQTKPQPKAEPKKKEEPKPVPRPEPESRPEVMGISTEDWWAKYANRATDTVQKILKPGEPIHEKMLIDLMAEPDALGLPKEVIAESILPEMDGTVLYRKGKTWVLPSFDVEYDYSEIQEVEEPTEIEEELEKKEEEVRKEEEAHEEAPADPDVKEEGKGSLMHWVELLQGLPEGPYKTQVSIWREALKHSDFTHPDGKPVGERYYWTVIPEALKYGVVRKEADGYHVVQDPAIVLTRRETEHAGTKLTKGCVTHGCLVHGRDHLDSQKHPRSCGKCKNLLSEFCNSTECGICPPCDFCRRDATQKKRIGTFQQNRLAKVDPVQMAKNHFGGDIPVLDRYTTPIRAVKNMVPSKWWDAMACLTLAKIMKLKNPETALPAKEHFEKLEWDRLAWETIRTEPVEKLAPFLKDELKDLNLTCVDCMKKFIFTVGEQKFFAERFGEEATVPKRCADCRKKARTR